MVGRGTEHDRPYDDADVVEEAKEQEEERQDDEFSMLQLASDASFDEADLHELDVNDVNESIEM